MISDRAVEEAVKTIEDPSTPCLKKRRAWRVARAYILQERRRMETMERRTMTVRRTVAGAA